MFFHVFHHLIVEIFCVTQHSWKFVEFSPIFDDWLTFFPEGLYDRTKTSDQANVYEVLADKDSHAIKIGSHHGKIAETFIIILWTILFQEIIQVTPLPAKKYLADEVVKLSLV